jgi:hypothetical protein
MALRREPPPKIAITDGHIDRVLTVVQRATGTVRRIEALIASPTRQREWSVPGILALYILLARWGPRGFRLTDTLERFELPNGAWERLGLVKPNGEPITYRQVRYGIQRISRLIDPYQPGLSIESRAHRQEIAHEVTTGLLVATLPRKLRRNIGAHLALDATLVWAYGREPGTGGEKLEGVRVQNEPIVLDTEDDTDPLEGQTSWEESQPTAPGERIELTPTGKRKRRAYGAATVGHSNPRKVVHGYAHHVTTITAGPDDIDVPNVAVGLHSTPAPHNAARAGIESVRHLLDALPAAGLAVTEAVAADAAYTISRWMTELNERGVDPVSRLHRGNQEGVHGTLAGGSIVLIDGRPFCACCPPELTKLLYPYKAWEKGNSDKLDPYWTELARRERYALQRRGRSTFRGSYTFFNPHHGGDCPRCGHLPPDQQCCQTKAIKIAPDELPNLQRHKFGTPEWERHYSARSRIEGYFSLLKTGNIVAYGRLWARFTDFGKITLATLFAMIAVNMNSIDRWFERQTLRDRGDDDGRPPRIDRPHFKDYLRRVADEVAAPLPASGSPPAAGAPPAGAPPSPGPPRTRSKRRASRRR